MDMPSMPAWVETALAYASVVIAALTGIVTFLEWAVPRLREIGARSGAKTTGLTAWLERAARAMGRVLDVVRRYVPRLTIGAPPERARVEPAKHDAGPIGFVGDLDDREGETPAPVAEDDEDDDDPDDPAPMAAARPTIAPGAPPPS